MSTSFAPLWPSWLMTLLIAALLAATVYSAVVMSLRGVAKRWVIVLTALRIAAAGWMALVVLQPTVTRIVSVESRPRALMLVDVSRSMRAADTTSDHDFQEGVNKLRHSRLAAKLEERYETSWFEFDRTARPFDDAYLALSAGGHTTRFAESIAAAHLHSMSDGSAPARVMLISDGRDRSSDSPVETAQRYGLKIDVLPYGAAATASPGGPQVTAVQSAQRVLLGSDTQFRVQIARTAAIDQEHACTLVVRDQGREVLRKALQFSPGESDTAVMVVHRPTVLGPVRYEFEIINPSDAAPAQNQPAAPPYVHHLQVVDDKHEVLILEDTWRWEYRFLQRLLEDDPSFRFTAFLARGRNSFLQLGSPDRQVSLVGLPQNHRDLANFDLLILGDVDPSRYSDAFIAALRLAVAEQGTSLVVLAGPNLGRFAAADALHALLPVVLSAQSGTPIEGPIAVRWPAEAVESPLFFQFASPIEELPPLDQIYPVVKRRPGATVLVEAVNHRNPYGPQIVMAEHHYGRGRVLFIGADTLWKWHSLASETTSGLTPYELFWQQTLRALAPAKTSRSLPPLWLTASRSRTQPDERVVLCVEAAANGAAADDAITAFATVDDGVRVPIWFHADPSHLGRWQAEFTPSSAGKWLIRASLSSAEQAAGAAEITIDVDDVQGESPGLGPDVTALARLAAATGGQVVQLDDPATWPQGSDQPQPIQRTVEYPLWDNWILIILLCCTLGLDWLLRALRGLT